MSSVLLGPSGSEVTLPVLRWLGGSRLAVPSWPVTINKQLSEKTMIDRSSRWGHYGKKREWSIELGYVSKAELDSLETLYGYSQALRFQNNNESSTWYDVVMVPPFDYEPVRMDIRQLEKYKVRINLKEA